MSNDTLVNNTIVVVLADHDVNFLREMETAFRRAPDFQVAALAQTGEDAVARCGEMAPDVLVTEYTMPDMQAPEIVRELARLSPGTMVFAVAGAVSAGLRGAALNNYSIKEVWDKRYVDLEQIVNDIRERVERFREEEREHTQKHGRVLPGTGPKGRREGTEAAPPKGPAVLRQSVILVHSPKGGVGKTTISSNLAVALKLSPVLSGWKVVLLDADTEFSNLAQVLDLPDAGVNHSIINWEYVDENIPQSDVEDLLVKHRSGVYFLAAPIHPVAGHKVTEELTDKVLRILRRYFGAIVIDGGPKLPPPVMASLDHATDIVLVTEPEMQGAENVARYLTLFEAAGREYLINKIRLVVNKVQNEKDDLTLREISGIGRMPVTRAVPYDNHAVRGSLHGHSGRLAVEAYPDSPFSVAIKQLANDLMNAYPGISARKVRDGEKRAGGGLFGLLRRAQ